MHTHVYAWLPVRRKVRNHDVPHRHVLPSCKPCTQRHVAWSELANMLSQLLAIEQGRFRSRWAGVLFTTLVRMFTFKLFSAAIILPTNQGDRSLGEPRVFQDISTHVQAEVVISRNHFPSQVASCLPCACANVLACCNHSQLLAIPDGLSDSRALAL